MAFRGIAATLLAMVMMFTMAGAPALAHHDDYYRYNRHRPDRVNSSRVVKTALIGAGIGAAVGAIASNEERRTEGAVKGAIIGGVAGTGYGYLKERQRVNQYRRYDDRYYGYNPSYYYNRPVGYYDNPYNSYNRYYY